MSHRRCHELQSATNYIQLTRRPPPKSDVPCILEKNCYEARFSSPRVVKAIEPTWVVAVEIGAQACEAVLTDGGFAT